MLSTPISTPKNSRTSQPREGSQPSSTANSHCNTGMLTRTGTEVNKSNTPMVSGSIQLPCRSAAQMPAGIPTPKMIRSARTLY